MILVLLSKPLKRLPFNIKKKKKKKKKKKGLFLNSVALNFPVAKRLIRLDDSLIRIIEEHFPYNIIAYVENQILSELSATFIIKAI